MLNCATCAQTQHHCCKASISFTIMEVIDLVEKAEKRDIDVKVLPSKDKPNYFNIVKKGKVFKSLNDENCIFLKDARCTIYEERPSICRVYGSEMVKCWFHNLDYDTPALTLFEMDEKTIKDLTDDVVKSNETSVIQFFQKKMK